VHGTYRDLDWVLERHAGLDLRLNIVNKQSQRRVGRLVSSCWASWRRGLLGLNLVRIPAIWSLRQRSLSKCGEIRKVLDARSCIRQGTTIEQASRPTSNSWEILSCIAADRQGAER
jgi:hypothetical protein